MCRNNKEGGGMKNQGTTTQADKKLIFIRGGTL
jgi:hypothetical protein